MDDQLAKVQPDDALGTGAAGSAARLSVGLARGDAEIEDALRLRFKVFGEELGAEVGDGSGLDSDDLDPHCDHIIVRDDDTLRVVGTYRVLPPHRARALGRLYSDSEFDLHRLEHLKPQMIEVGRSCVHRDYRDGPTIMLLWARLAQYMKQNAYRYMVGCASATLADGGGTAAFVRDTAQRYLTLPDYRVFPRVPFPHERIERLPQATLPPLIKGYLRLGARIGGEPAWDPAFNTADFLVLLDLAHLNGRYARHFDLLAGQARG